MNYINFVILTDTPARLRTFLINRGIIKETELGSGIYCGARPGMEWVRVPNPIQTSAGPPPVYDTRNVYLVKFAHESAANEDDGTPQTDVNGDPVNQYDWSKFGKWVKLNSTVVAAPVNYTINGEHAGDAYKINAELVWLVRDRPERFGVWQ